MPQIGHNLDNVYEALYYTFVKLINENFLGAGKLINKIKYNLIYGT